LNKYYDQLIKDVNRIVRDSTIKAEYDLLIEYGSSPRQAKTKLSNKRYIDPRGNPYYLTESGIENIIYPLEVKGEH